MTFTVKVSKQDKEDIKGIFLNILSQKDQYLLSNIHIENSCIRAEKYGLERSEEEGFDFKYMNINKGAE